MKSIKNLLIGMVITGSLAAGLHFLHAQETATAIQGGAVSQDVNSMSDTEVLLQTIESVPPGPASTAPRAGTFWSAQHAPGTRSPWPPLPSDNGLSVWNLGDGVYLLDDLQVDYSLPVSSRMAGGMMTPDGFGLPGGDTNGGSPLFLTPPVYTTNDLWLQMDGITNTTAYLTIHPPWTVTNGVYDLFYTTNLSPPQVWSWVLRSFAGLTNLTVNNAVDAQGFYRLGQTNDLLENDSLGTNFWVAFYSVEPSGGNDIELSLYISSPVGASGTVSNSALGITTNFTVAAGAVTNISISSDAMMYRYDAVENYGIHIAASQPVSVYAMYYCPSVSAAFTGYPTTLLGTNYRLMARPSLIGSTGSEFAIMATADNTTVTITPSPTADLTGSRWNNPITNLQAGQTYQISSGESRTNIQEADVTGTWITSDKPIAVFAGASYADVPDGDTGLANPLMQEQLPVNTWGTLTLGLSFAGRTNGDCYRVLAAYDDTVVTITGTVVTITNEPGVGPWQVTKTNEVVVTNLVAGQFCDIIVEGPVEFQASQPIQVAHFANGSDFDHPPSIAGNQNEADPCEILLPPIGHYLLTNIVFTLTNDLPNQVIGDFDEDFLNLIVAQSAITNTFVDGSIVATNNFVPIGTSGYYGARLPMTTGTYKVTSSRPVGVEVYGWGWWDAYGYFGGIVK
jgi:hypothetical protein